MSSDRDIVDILEAMHALFGDYPATELRYQTPFQCLVAVMMSAQTTDVQVNKVNEVFFQHVRTPWDVVRMGEEQVAGHINTV